MWAYIHGAIGGELQLEFLSVSLAACPGSAIVCTHHSTWNIRICSAAGIDFCSLVFFLPNLFLSLFQSCASFPGLDQWWCFWPECANSGLNGAGRSGKTLNWCYFLWKISDIFFIWLMLQLITARCPVVSGGSQWVFTVFPTFLKTFLLLPLWYCTSIQICQLKLLS